MRPPFGPPPERVSPAAGTFGPQFLDATRASPTERGGSPARLEALAPVKAGSPVARPQEATPPRAEPSDGEAAAVPLMRAPGREEGSVFGGLVSYFSSQHEDDIDA